MDVPGQAKLRGAWPETATGALRPGMTLGRYELLVPVGVGGMACVWAARLSGYRGFSKLVAVKTVLPHLAGHHDFENMLLDEARIAADAHHPNVCNLFDVGEENGILYLVLEWVEGDSLLQVIRAARPSGHSAVGYRVAARIAADACAGLHAAHELVDDRGIPLGVVHRDVSPHNLLVAIDGTTKIADFGVAKAQGQLHQATRAGEIRGKLAYMAPEQMNGGGLDRRADVFAMGGVLYHATTGQPPFRGDSDARLIRAVLDGQYEPPDRLAPDYPAELAAIVTRALTADVNRRFQTANQMQSALEAWLTAAGQPTTANDVGAVVRQRIGARLESRRQEVRSALEADRVSGSTRPVRAAVASPFDSGTLRATRSAGDEPSPLPAPLGGAPIRLLPPASPADPVAAPLPVLPSAAPARSGSLKVAGAVVLGLVTATAVLSLRSVLDSRKGESPSTAIASAAPPAEPSPTEPLPASTGAPRPRPYGSAASASPAVAPEVRSAVAAAVAPRTGSQIPSTTAPAVAARVPEPVAPRTAPPPGRPPSFAGGGLALPANPY
jgi:serine/threonine protein kinase